MKKNIVIRIGLLCVCCLPLFCCAWPWDKGNIKGTVLDVETSQNLEGVKVTIEENNSSVQTDGFGEFIFRDLKPGTYTLSFKKPGFKPKSITETVKGKNTTQIKVELQADVLVYNVRMWMKKAASRIADIMGERNYKNQKIAIAFFKESGGRKCDLPALTLRFATAFNKLGLHGNDIVIRDKNQAGLLIQELKTQNQFKVDFDPATVAKIGRKLGADVFIIGALLESKDYVEPQVNGASVETQAYIPGLSINEILLKRGEIRCE